MSACAIVAVCVIDPGTQFMQSWNSRFETLEISHLRSPAFVHPMAFEPTALVSFAISEGRTSELVGAPNVAKLLATADLSQQEPLLTAQPSSALFRDFCSRLEARLPHRWISGTATDVCKDSHTGKFCIHYRATADQRELKVSAKAVIVATGPVGKRHVPAPFLPIFGSRFILHTEELTERDTSTLREEITRRCAVKSSGKVLVIGGGLSAAQAALAAARAGHQVVLRSRRPLQTRAYDTLPEWFDARHANRLRFKFLSLPVEERLEAVREAMSGGSVPATYLEELYRLSSQESNLKLEIDTDIEQSKVCIVANKSCEQVVVNGEAFGLVILATGVAPMPSCSALYRSVQENFDAPMVHGLPHVDSLLRWVPDEDIFVLGVTALLQLGPGGGNLMGAMRGAKIVSNELHGLMWQPYSSNVSCKVNRGVARQQTFSNQYAALYCSEESSEAESYGSDSSDEVGSA